VTRDLKILAFLVGIALCYIAATMAQSQDKKSKSFDRESIERHLEAVEKMQAERGLCQAPTPEAMKALQDRIIWLESQLKAHSNTGRFQAVSHGTELLVLDTRDGKMWRVEKGRWIGPVAEPQK
jgi:hypothetical protein